MIQNRKLRTIISCILATWLLTGSLSAYGEKIPSEDVEAVQFTPPTGWRYAEPHPSLKNVRIMVVGEGKNAFPPSINLAIMPFKGNLKAYLKNVKSINEAHGDVWKDLGTIRTEAGDASLSQLDTKVTWGDVRMMHVILIKNETAYVLTVASLKEEFSKYYKDFFRAMRSLRFTKGLRDNNLSDSAVPKPQG